MITSYIRSQVDQIRYNIRMRKYGFGITIVYVDAPLSIDFTFETSQQTKPKRCN